MPIIRLTAHQLLDLERRTPWKPSDLEQGVHVTPDDALAAGFCPECGRPMSEINVLEEIDRHWPRERSDEALRRIKLLQGFYTKQQADKAQAEAAKAEHDPEKLAALAAPGNQES